MNPVAGRYRVRASPVARRLASLAGLDIAAVPGTGPGGRIVRRDVETAISDPDLSTNTLANKRDSDRHPRMDIVAKQHVSVSRLVDLQHAVNANRETPVSVTALIAKAVARAFSDGPPGESPRRVHASRPAITPPCDVAVLTPRGDVRVVRGRGDRSIERYSTAIDLESVPGKPETGSRDGADMLVVDLGAAGVSEYSYPRPVSVALVLAVGAMEERVVATAEGIGIRLMLTCTVNADSAVYRADDVCTRLRTLQRLLEEPAALLIE